ncbi:MAG TPA: response regulator transcription factor [Solirubrobacterales bacterium]|jgi:DNA-binding response OmpR family regulator|nr:response regulator transcription factor [Solirubrobacterales bacterium]
MEAPVAKILLVDDEAPIQRMLEYPLKKDGYDVVIAGDGEEALEKFRGGKFDLVVLDIMLPKLDGLEVCKEIRSQSNVPIVMLTARADEVDKVIGLELGADDYMTKPFSLREFRSRVKAALRRAGMTSADSKPQDRTIKAGSVEIDPGRRVVTVNGEEISLTFMEFEILMALASEPGRVLTREALLERVWGDSAYRDIRTVDVHIRHLREKVEPDASNPEYILTVRNVGYRFRDN